MGKGVNKCQQALGAQVEVPGANGASFTVTPGLVDDAAREAYLGGQCAALAAALHELRGGQIVAIGYDDTAEQYEEWEANPSWGHVGLVMSDGSVLDIEGKSRDLESWMERHQYWEVKDITPDEALSLPGFPEQDVDVARAMAKSLLGERG